MLLLNLSTPPAAVPATSSSPKGCIIIPPSPVDANLQQRQDSSHNHHHLVSRRRCLRYAAAAPGTLIAHQLVAAFPAAASAGAIDRGNPPPAIVVTGASSGIGQACARALAAAGYEVVLGCRDPGRASQERDRLMNALPDAHVIVPAEPLELMDLAAVSAFAQEVRERLSGEASGPQSRLEGLLLCAGVDGIPVERTPQGLEQHMCINHLSGFLLAAELRPLLEAGNGGRVITLTSSAALDCDPQGLSDINWARRKFDRRQAYCLSKACGILAADELAQRGRGGLRACSVDPGPCATQIVRYSQPQRARQRLGMTEEQLAKQAQQLGMRTAKEGASLPASFAAGDPGPAGETFVNGGMYLGAAAPPGSRVPLWGSQEPGLEWRSREASAAVWEQSVALVERAASRGADFS